MTHQEWAEQVLTEHGPPPQHIVEELRAIVRRVQDRADD